MPQKRTAPRFGAHLSAAGGLQNAIQQASHLGCECLQVFVKNQRQWAGKPLTSEQIRSYKNAARRATVRPVVAHASYLLNLASPDRTVRDRSIHALADEADRCDRLGIQALIFHPGAHMHDAPAQGIRRVANALNRVRKAREDHRCRILLECTAGQGTALGRTFQQLADIIHRTNHAEQLGVCLDTCHLFAAGYDFRTKDGYDAMMEELDSAIGVTSVECIHVNDSKRESGSRVDRHEHIGRGKIGSRGFAHFVNDVQWSGLPFILETPKGKDGRGTDLDKVNIRRLRKLLQ